MPSRLGIDWGKARIGVAVAQSPTWLAFPVTVVPGGKQALAQLVSIVEEYEPEVVYIGVPLALDGTPKIAAEWVEQQARRLAGEIPDVAIRMVDERMSTAAAYRQLHAAGRTARTSRGIIDAAAAVEILQRALTTETQTEHWAGYELKMEES